MLAYTFQRLLLSIPTIFVISVLSFVLIQLPPGDFLSTHIAELQSQGESVDMAKIEFLRQQYGLDRSAATITELRHLMWRHVGILRDGDGLAVAAARLDEIDHPSLTLEARNMVLAARLITRAALERTESRGAHQRLDHPGTDPAWACHVDISLVASTHDGGTAHLATRCTPHADPTGATR